jgi:hypothetical protein
MIENIIYNTKCDTRNTGDLYLPENADRNTPLALSIHGGGWSAMDKSSFAGVAEFLCGLGMAVFNIDYRLLTDAPWPICGDDCLRAAGFLLEARHPSLDYLNHGKNPCGRGFGWRALGSNDRAASAARKSKRNHFYFRSLRSRI